MLLPPNQSTFSALASPSCVAASTRSRSAADHYRYQQPVLTYVLQRTEMQTKQEQYRAELQLQIDEAKRKKESEKARRQDDMPPPAHGWSAAAGYSGGGGAPFRDQNGNLVTNVKAFARQMAAAAEGSPQLRQQQQQQFQHQQYQEQQEQHQYQQQQQYSLQQQQPLFPPNQPLIPAVSEARDIAREREKMMLKQQVISDESFTTQCVSCCDL
jgi:exonuclease VII large subunit